MWAASAQLGAMKLPPAKVLGLMVLGLAGVTAAVQVRRMSTGASSSPHRDGFSGKQSAAEAYHMGMVRSILFRQGQRARNAANAISAARDRLDGPGDKDQGIVLNGRANVAPADANGIAFSRTPPEVLRIAYLTPRSRVTGGGFYPQGVNGAIVST